MRKSFFLALIALFSVSLAAQNQMPIDTNVRKGTLPNGLTYYIRHNEQPKQRAEFHIAQNVGAILEQDEQNGLAHFLEHMAFNGSQHFPDKLIINYFESIGVNFGGNINAYTSLDETVYRLSDVPTTREGIIDSALLVLYDWSCALTLDNEEIDAERGVILEEWRTGNNAARRMWKASSAQKYVGSQYAKRDVIGDTAIIKHFEYDALKNYYKKWYGPDLQAIMVVGDIDVAQIEQKIKDLWENVPPRVNRGERPIYYLQDNNILSGNKEPIVSIVTDKEAQNSRITFEFFKRTSPNEFKLSDMGYTFSIYNNLISKIFSYRFDEQALKPEANFLAAYIGHENITKGNEALTAISIPKEGKEKEALRDLYSEVVKTFQYGFTNAELERAKTNMLNTYEKSFNERNNNQNISLTLEYIKNYLDAEPAPGIEWEYNYLKQLLPTITMEKLNSNFKILLNPIENSIIALQMSEKEGITVPTKEEILNILEEVEKTQFTAPKEEVIAKNLVDKAPKAGKISKITQNASLGTTEWLLSNGVKVVLKPTEFKKDEILFQAFSKGGLNTVEAIDDLPSAATACDIVEYSGLGKFSAIDLQKILTGKSVSCSSYLTDFYDGVEGNSSVKDFEMLLQLIYLGFTEIRKDDEAFNAMIELYKNSVINREKQPKNIFRDTLSQDWTCHSPRNMPVNIDYVSKIDNQKALNIFRQRFSNANDFIFTFTGNINPNDKQTQKLICTWLGSLPKGKIENYVYRENCRPKGRFQNHFTRKMETENSTNAIRYYVPMEYNLANDINMDVVGRVLDIRYLESIREKEGGSYGVGVGGDVNFMRNEAVLYVQFDCNPDKQVRLLEIVHQEINEIINNGVRADDLQKVKESLLKDYAENIEKNDWWSSNFSMYYLNNINYFEYYKSEVQKVTAESVQNALKQLVGSGNIFEVVMNPEKQ
jgi:zinc protease